jgi:lipopolysaccharide transport system permease protein
VRSFQRVEGHVILSDSVPADIASARFSARSSRTNKPLNVNDSRASSGFLKVREIWTYRDLFYFLTWRDIKVRYKQAAMGAAWAVIQPFGIMLIFAVFFGVFIGVPTDGMPHTLFFYAALVPWMFFSSAVNAGSVSLINSSNLVTKVYFPRMIVPAAAVGGLFVDLLITCAILIALAIYYHMLWTWGLLIFPAMIGLSILLALEFSIWLAALTVKYRDIRHALPFVLQLWMFLTPILYPLSVVPEKWRWLMHLNPLTGVAEGVRSSVTGHTFNWSAITFSVAIAILMLPISIQAFQRIEKSFADLI